LKKTDTFTKELNNTLVLERLNFRQNDMVDWKKHKYKFPGQQIELSLEDFDLDIDTMTLLEFCCDLKSDVTNNLWEMMLDCASREGKWLRWYKNTHVN
jgi:hypothetical protein